MNINITFDGVSIAGSPVIFRRKLGQFQLLVCKDGMVYSMTTSWSPALLFSVDSLGFSGNALGDLQPATAPTLTVVPPNQQEI